MTLKETNELFAADLRDPSYAAGYLDIALEEDGAEKSALPREKPRLVQGAAFHSLDADTDF